MMAVFFFITHEKGFKFHAQPQTGAYSCYIYIDIVPTPMIEIYEISVLLAVEATLCGGAADLYMHTEINQKLK